MILLYLFFIKILLNLLKISILQNIYATKPLAYKAVNAEKNSKMIKAIDSPLRYSPYTNTSLWENIGVICDYLVGSPYGLLWLSPSVAHQKINKK